MWRTSVTDVLQHLVASAFRSRIGDPNAIGDLFFWPWFIRILNFSLSYSCILSICVLTACSFPNHPQGFSWELQWSHAQNIYPDSIKLVGSFRIYRLSLKGQGGWNKQAVEKDSVNLREYPSCLHIMFWFFSLWSGLRA